MKKVLLALLIISLANQCSPKQKRHNDGFCSIGTEELNVALSHWSHFYNKKFPSTHAKNFIHEGRGSLVAPKALFKQICDLAPMSKPMTSAQIDTFVSAGNGQPIGIPVAIEALAIVSHKKTAIQKITMEQIQSLYGRTPATYASVFSHADKEFQMQTTLVCGINSASDRYQWVRRDILHGKYGDRILEMGSSALLSKSISNGTCEFTYLRPNESLTKNTQIVKVENPKTHNSFLLPTQTNILSGNYPIARYYYIYLPPLKNSQQISPHTIKFLTYILSFDAQSKLTPLGLFPVDHKAKLRALQNLAKYNTKNKP